MSTEQPTYTQDTFAIAFLVHDEVDSAHTALSTLNAFFKWTDLPSYYKPDFYIVINGQNQDIEDVIELFRKAYADKVNFIIHQFKENLGCSAGVNHLAHLTRHYKYTFFLERDWILSDPYNKQWLTNAVDYMESAPDVDMIYFRRQVSSLEARQYYGNQPYITTESIKFGGIEYRKTGMHRYTNNPHLRRNFKFWEYGVLPLPNIENEIKTNPHWGDAENLHEQLPENFVAVYQEHGIFVHFAPMYFDQISNFGHAPAMHPVFDKELLRCHKCRFGFMKSEEPEWCDRCIGTNRTYEEVEELFVECKQQEP